MIGDHCHSKSYQRLSRRGLFAHTAEVLGEFEVLWRPRLARVSLTAELDFIEQELNTALFCAGQRWRVWGAGRAERSMAAVPPCHVRGGSGRHHQPAVRGTNGLETDPRGGPGSRADFS
jgi:hypothetical protein